MVPVENDASRSLLNCDILLSCLPRQQHFQACSANQTNQQPATVVYSNGKFKVILVSYPFLRASLVSYVHKMATPDLSCRC